MREKGKKRAAYSRAVLVLLISVLMVCSVFASSAFADTTDTGSSSSAASTETRSGTAYTASENGNNTSNGSGTESTEQKSAATPSNEPAAASENGNNTTGSSETGSTSSSSAVKTAAAASESSTDNTSGSSGTGSAAERTYKVETSGNGIMQINGKTVFCMDNRLAEPEDAVKLKQNLTYSENSENKEYQRVKDNPEFRSELGYVMYAGVTDPAGKDADAYATQVVIWTLMNKYGISSNDDLTKDILYQKSLPLISKLYDNGTTTHVISPDENTAATLKLKVVSTDGSSAPVFTYKNGKWISSGLKVVAVTADGTETEYTGSFELPDLPETASISTGGAEGILNTAFYLEMTSEPSENTTITVKALIPYLSSIKFYSPNKDNNNEDYKNKEGKTYQNLIGASVDNKPLSTQITIGYTKPSVPADNSGNSTDNNGSGNNGSGSSDNNGSGTNNGTPSTPVTPSNTDNNNGGSTTPEPVTPSNNNNNGSSTTPSVPSNTDNGKSSGTSGGNTVKPKQPAAPSASGNTSAGSKTNGAVSPAVKKTSSAVQTNPSIQPASSSSVQTSASASAPASGLSAEEPKTGDTTDLTLWTALALTSAAGAAVLLLLRKKRSAEK